MLHKSIVHLAKKAGVEPQKVFFFVETRGFSCSGFMSCCGALRVFLVEFMVVYRVLCALCVVTSAVSTHSWTGFLFSS